MNRDQGDGVALGHLGQDLDQQPHRGNRHGHGLGGWPLSRILEAQLALGAEQGGEETAGLAGEAGVALAGRDRRYESAWPAIFFRSKLVSIHEPRVFGLNQARKE
jgi:hypothetical protein